MEDNIFVFNVLLNSFDLIVYRKWFSALKGKLQICFRGECLEIQE